MLHITRETYFPKRARLHITYALALVNHLEVGPGWSTKAASRFSLHSPRIYRGIESRAQFEELIELPVSSKNLEVVQAETNEAPSCRLFFRATRHGSVWSVACGLRGLFQRDSLPP